MTLLQIILPLTLKVIRSFSLITFIFIGTLTLNVQAGDIDNIRFPESAWDGAILNILRNGPLYLDKNIEFNLPPPPLNSSEETQNELKLLRVYASDERTDAQISKIKIEAMKGDFSEIFLNEGPFSQELKRSSYHLLRFADKEIVYFIVRNKKRFSRPRPSQLAPELELVVPNPGHAAYPSGHATQSMVFARILGLIVPEDENIYINYAKAIAKRREIAGVHYPSDSATGQLLALKLFEALRQEPEFIRNLEQTMHRFRILNNTINN